MKKKDIIKEYMTAMMKANPTYTREDLIKAATEHFRYGEIEIAMQLLCCLNSYTISHLLDFVWDKKKISQDGRLRQILNATEKKTREKETLVGVLCKKSGDREGETDFVDAMSDAMDVFDDVLLPVFEALYRCIKQSLEKKKEEDAAGVARAAMMLVLVGMNREVYDTLARKVYPAIDSIPNYGNALSGVMMEQQMEKIATFLYGDRADKAVQAKGVKDILYDLSSILFSTELCNRIFEPRGGHIDLGVKSFLRDQKTMSLNYYKLHYNAAYQ